ncbi:helix-turn-helix domain-containing protein [Halorarius litoreus]|uniref:helix-turn-helix domain-containing protein n=1 Tax=Halorarius litoreus TaxID=2962676 RepID=UPI0020CD7DC0|nr:helix-turn-helix domain-containing protein [Halorarius litoreus]
MRKLDEIAADRLRAALDDAEDAKAAKRLMVAIAYKDGVDVETISRRYGIPQSTVYYWLDRFESMPIDDALRDEQRPGRPPKLSAAQRAEVESWLEASPAAVDIDADGWTATLLRDHIHDTFDVEYSVAHVSRTFLE